MVKRTISGVVMAVVSIVLIVLGNIPFGIYVMLISIVGAFELARATGVRNPKKKINILEVLIYLATIAMYLALMFAGEDRVDQTLITVFVVFILVLFGVYVFSFPGFKATDIMGTVFIVMYVPFLASFLYRIRAFTEHNLIMTFLVLIVACGSDISAYFVGSTLGKHKLAPVLSPKKSIEGAVGAVICTAIICTVYALGLCAYDVVPVKYIYIFAVIGAVGSIVSQIGDLTASAVKRNYDIKDYGKIIPGHGGALDRIDSILVVSPIIYLLAQWLL